jgi:hypothetical protein
LAEHPDSKTRENILGKLGGKRRTALGIGCEGYIGRLLSIKKANQNK